MSDVEALRKENAALRARLSEVERSEARMRERQKWVLERGGRLLVPLIDRQQVARNFVALFRTCAGFAGPREAWPAREEVVDAAEAFTTSMVRFIIRRRMVYLGISLVAIAMPILQVWLLVQQNQFIRLQNSLIEIQADDIVARGVTSDNVVTNQINGALLANREMDDLVGMIRRVFGADIGEQFLLSPESRKVSLRTAGGRGHLLLALREAIRSPGDESPPSPRELWRKHLADGRTGALPEILTDAPERAFVVLTTPRAAFTGDDADLEVECQRYLYGLMSVLRQAHALAVAEDDRARFYELTAKTFYRLSLVNAEDSPLRQPFALMSQEFLLDLAEDRAFGSPEGAVPRNVDAALAAGFGKLQKGIGNREKVNWPRLRALMGVK